MYTTYTVNDHVACCSYCYIKIMSCYTS